jgi:hypothetical protein
VDRQIQEAWAGAMDSKITLDTHIKDIDTPFGAAKYAGKGVTWAKAEGDFNYAAALALALHGIRCTAVGACCAARLPNDFWIAGPCN